MNNYNKDLLIKMLHGRLLMNNIWTVMPQLGHSIPRWLLPIYLEFGTLDVFIEKFCHIKFWPISLIAVKTTIAQKLIEKLLVIIGGSEGEAKGCFAPLDSCFAPLGLFKQWSQPLQAGNYSQCFLVYNKRTCNRRLLIY